MSISRRVAVSHYERLSSPLRIAVGDVIRCPAFSSAVWLDSELLIVVEQSWADYQLKVGRVRPANDASRARAPFLVESMILIEGEGPADVAPGNHRLSREVRCLRLTEDYGLSPKSERIRFNLDEPMSVTRPKAGSIEVIGFAQLPISWNEGS